MSDIEQVIAAKFRSGNDVPVTSVRISLDEWQQIQTQLKRLQGESEWVSVDDRLPELSGEIVAYCKNGFITTVMYRAEKKGQPYEWDCDVFALEDVTHWQPLPTPPTKREY